MYRSMAGGESGKVTCAVHERARSVFHHGGACRKPGNSPRQYYLDRVLRVFLSLVRENCAAYRRDPNRAPLFLICFPLNHRFLGIRKLSRPTADTHCHRWARVETAIAATQRPASGKMGATKMRATIRHRAEVRAEARSGSPLRKPTQEADPGNPLWTLAQETQFKLNLRRTRDHGARPPVLRSSRCRATRSRDGGHFAFRNPA